MKKIALLVLVVAVMVAFTVPAFAADAGATKEASIFQKMADSMTLGPGKQKNKVIEFSGPKLPTTSHFQEMSTGIQEGSAKARTESLRTNISTK